MLYVEGFEVQTGLFPNGESYVSVNDDYFYQKSHLKITLRFENNNDLINLMMLKKHFDDQNKQCRLEVLYFPYSRMDRSNDHYAFSLKYIADFINSLNFYKVTIMEAHSDVTPALLNKVSSFSWIEKHIALIKHTVKFNEELDLLCYPDAGAVKRYAHKLKTPYCYGSKNRNFQTGEIEEHSLIRTDFSTPNKVIIVDDLCSRGGTFKSMADQIIKEFGEHVSVYLAVAHCENNVFNGELIKDNSPIERIFTSDSIIRTNHEKIEVIRD